MRVSDVRHPGNAQPASNYQGARGARTRMGHPPNRLVEKHEESNLVAATRTPPQNEKLRKQWRNGRGAGASKCGGEGEGFRLRY